MLIASLFFMKSLVETVLLRPYRYKLLHGRREDMDRPTDNNLAFLATIITQIYRLIFPDQEGKRMVQCLICSSWWRLIMSSCVFMWQDVFMFKEKEYLIISIHWPGFFSRKCPKSWPAFFTLTLSWVQYTSASIKHSTIVSYAKIYAGYLVWR